MVRRYIFVKLNDTHRTGLKLVQVLSTAKQVLPAAYGVQAMHVGHAADDATRAVWDLCFTLDFVSDVDLAQSEADAVTKAFLTNYLGQRASAIWTATFEGHVGGPRRL